MQQQHHKFVSFAAAATLNTNEFSSFSSIFVMFLFLSKSGQIFPIILRSYTFSSTGKKEKKRIKVITKDESTTKRSIHNCYVRMNNCVSKIRAFQGASNMNDSLVGDSKCNTKRRKATLNLVGFICFTYFVSSVLCFSINTFKRSNKHQSM